MIDDLIKLAFTAALMAPFIIVGTGVVFGLTLAITNTMLGVVLGILELFSEREE
ncbi:MAG: hypothetical protein ACO3O3_12555 [Ilumatobacteraceae bacterium]